MVLENHFFWIKNAIPKRYCDLLIKQGLSQDSIDATTGDFSNRDVKDNPLNKKEKKFLHKTRKSNVVWIVETWLYRLYQPFVNYANQKAGWNFQWDFSENNQFTIYNKGQYYGWHCDSWKEPYNNPQDINRHGKIRKLSSTILLNSSKEFSGGEFEFDYRDQIKKNTELVQNLTEPGDMIVFPSHLFHRVKPVTKGKRYSLVSWHLGRPFQ